MGPVLPEGERDGTRATATYREVVAMVDASRKEIIAEIKKLEAKVDAKFEGHATKHEAERDTHEVEHRRDMDRRTGYIRWAVTSLLTGAGVLLSIYLALKGSGP